jgi:hypothetical protein
MGDDALRHLFRTAHDRHVLQISCLQLWATAVSSDDELPAQFMHGYPTNKTPALTREHTAPGRARGNLSALY